MEPQTDPANHLKELLEACEVGDLARVRELVTPETVNSKNDEVREACTALHIAAGYGDAEVVEFLLSSGASVTEQDSKGLLPLHNASLRGHTEIVELLLKAGANPNTGDGQNYTPLHEAAKKGDIDICLALLQYGADPKICNSEGKSPADVADAIIKPILITNYREYHKDELLKAIRTGANDKVPFLLQRVDVNGALNDKKCSTPLHVAAGYNRGSIVKLLLENGADIRTKDKKGTVALYNACAYGHVEIAKVLVKHGANVNTTDRWEYTPLHDAAEKSRSEMCSYLLSEGANPTLVNFCSKTAIDMAPTQELKDKIAYEYKGHCLLDAAKKCDLDKIRNYLTADIINFRHPYTKDTAVHAVASSSYPKRKKVLQALIQNGAKVNKKNKNSLTPLHLAADNSHYDVMIILLKNGAIVDELDNLGQTALHRCARQDDIQACRILLSYDVDRDIISQQGYLAAQVASKTVSKILPDPYQGTADTDSLLDAAVLGDVDEVERILGLPYIANECGQDGGDNKVTVVDYILQLRLKVHKKDKK